MYLGGTEYLFPLYENRQSFSTFLIVLISIKYGLVTFVKCSSSNRILGISFVVEWTLLFTFSHHAYACLFKSSRFLYFIPTIKFSRTYLTVRSIFPFVCPLYGLHKIGLKLKKPAKSSNVLFNVESFYFSSLVLYKKS